MGWRLRASPQNHVVRVRRAARCYLVDGGVLRPLPNLAGTRLEVARLLGSVVRPGEEHTMGVGAVPGARLGSVGLVGLLLEVKP